MACLLGEDWTEPRLEELCITPDRCLLARPAGEATFKVFIGAEKDLLRNIHGIAKVAELDGDELGFLLGKVAETQHSRGSESTMKLGLVPSASLG